MIHVYSHQIGPDCSPRWVVKTNRDLFWHGDGWTAYAEEALLYHDEHEAGRFAARIMNDLFEMLPVWKYTAIVEVEAFGFIKPSLADLKEHLWEKQALDLVFADSGPENTIVLSVVDWSTLKEDAS